MGHKVLKDHAHTFCQMFVGWRMSQDLSLFATIPEGELTIDVLQGTCTHDSLGTIETYIAGEISSWFKHRMTVHDVLLSDILEATLTVQLKRLPQKSKRHRGVTFDWCCDGCVKTTDREYKSQLREPHTWIPAMPRQQETGTNNPMAGSGGSADS